MKRYTFLITFLITLLFNTVVNALQIDIVGNFENINATSYSAFISDIDNNGVSEIIVGSRQGLFIFDKYSNLLAHVKLNKSVYGLAVSDINNDEKNEIIVSANKSIIVLDSKMNVLYEKEMWEKILTSPAILDVNKDNLKEVFVTLSNGELVAMYYNLSFMWKFKPLPMIKMSKGVRSNPLVFDVNNDGLYEIVYGTRFKRIFVLDAITGELLCFKRVGYDVDASPAVADLNKDGKYEIIFATGEPLNAIGDNTVYVIDGNCNIIWKYRVGGAVDSSPVIADINNDGWDEVLVTTLKDGSLYALSYNGKLLWKWPKDKISCCEYKDRNFFCYYKFGGCRSYITPSVIYSDNQSIVIFSRDDGIYYFINGSNGNLLYEFDSNFSGSNRFSPVAYDVDRDGNVEVVISNKNFYVISIKNSTSDWPFFRHDSSHTGNMNKLTIRKLKNRKEDVFVYIKYYLYIYLDILEFYFCYYQKLFSFLLNDPNPFNFIC